MRRQVRLGRRSLKIAALGCAAGLVVAGCGSSHGSATASTEKSSSNLAGKKVAIFNLVHNSFVSCNNKYLTKTLEAAGLGVSVYFSEFNPATALQNVQDALVTNIDGAIYASNTPASDAQGLKLLARKKVPTTFLAAAPEGTSPQAQLVYDNEGGGRMAVEELVKLMPNVAHVGIIPGTAGVPTSEESLAGMKQALSARGLRPEAVVAGNFSAQVASQVTQDMLQAHPDIQAILAMGDEESLAAARVVKSSHRKVAVIDEYAYEAAALEGVKSGELLALAWAPLPEWSEQQAKAMIGVLSGKKYTTPISLKMTPVSKQNVDSVVGGC